MDDARVFSDFQKVRGYLQNDEIRAFEYRRLGNLVITSGKIVACDPYYCVDTEPFAAQQIPTGQYPVIVSIAHLENSDQRIAYAAILFGDTLPVSWRFAAPSGEDETYGYCVDSGTGCFMDVDAVNAFAPICEPYDVDTDPLLAQMSRQYTNTWGWANLCMNQETGTNIIAFSSGWGDGGYSSYFGYDENEHIVCLLTDFGLLDEEEGI